MKSVKIKCLDKESGKYRISGTDINLKQTFDCGQCFRFNFVDGKWQGVAHGRFIALSQEEDGFTIENTTLDDINNLWINYFDLEHDYSDIAKEFSEDLFVKTAAEYGKGIRILNQEPEEVLYSFIISANNNISRIKKIVEAFSALFGKEIYVGNKIYYAFPKTEDIQWIETEDLEPIRAGFRDKYIVSAVKQIIENKNIFNEIANADTDTARELLKTFKGIGNKVADCILLFGFGKYDVFPKDVWINRVTEEMYGKDFNEKNFGKNAGIIQQYLFYYGRSNPQMLKNEYFKDDVRILPLSEAPEYTSEVAKALYEEFARPTETENFFQEMIENSNKDYPLPKTFIALIGDNFVGTVGLWRSDLMSRQDIFPWLALLYVKPEFRKRHIGAKLQKYLLDYSKALGYDKVFLYTDLINYYDKTGWTPFGTGTECDGTEKKLYYYDLK